MTVGTWTDWANEDPEACCGYVLSIALKKLYTPDELTENENKMWLTLRKFIKREFDIQDEDEIRLTVVAYFLGQYLRELKGKMHPEFYEIIVN